MNDFFYLLARAGLAALFLVSGFGKAMNVNNVANVLAAKGFPQPTSFGYAVAALELIGGLLILIGVKTRWVAVALLLFVGGTIYMSHNFWDMEGPARMANQVQALKNLAIMGGMLLLALAGPGRFSVDGRRSV